jgi:CDP-diacylglycerol pyrophosphatase
VWALNQEYVAIRDLKMCGCPAGFVHGLALPRFTVTGVEDPRRPDGIWPFAWDVARARIPEEDEIALAVNPPELRTQAQLHLHLVRLLPGARAQVDALRPIRVERLEDVWPAAAEHAASRQLASYGVILIRGLDGGWLVAAVGGSPEGSFTRSRCVS